MTKPAELPSSTMSELLEQISVPQPGSETLPEQRLSLSEYLKNHKVGIFTLIAKPDADGTPMILLAHRTDIDMWNVPGGGVDNPENSLEQEAGREAKEETGLDVMIGTKRQFIVNAPVPPQSTSYAMGTNGAWRFDASVWAIGTITGGELALNEEADGLQWVRMDSLPENTYVRHAMFLNSLTSADFLGSLDKAAEQNALRPPMSIAGVGLPIEQN